MSVLDVYLNNLHGALPDMSELQKLGVPLKTAIQICQDAVKTSSENNSITNSSPPEIVASQDKITPESPTAEHCKTNSAPQPVRPAKQMGIANMDRPAIVAPPIIKRHVIADPPAATLPEAIEPLIAADRMHSLATMVESGYASAQQLFLDGWSSSTAGEIARVINTARKFNR